LSYTRSPSRNAIAAREPSTGVGGLTEAKLLPYHAIRMTTLAATVANPTARRWWWRGATLAARWRD
jgi:hypothetical protein